MLVTPGGKPIKTEKKDIYKDKWDLLKCALNVNIKEFKRIANTPAVKKNAIKSAQTASGGNVCAGLLELMGRIEQRETNGKKQNSETHAQPVQDSRGEAQPG